MRVGLVCPYSLDIPGGVQNHVHDLAEVLLDMGHDVSVLAPSEDEAGLPPYVVATGRSLPVPYNGSVARVSFGPVVASRVRRWLRDGDFDVLHVHEPATPSISLLALAAADCPVVATFHTAQVRSRAMSASAGILRPFLEKIDARIAVSEYARDTLVQHIGGEPVIVPNGVHVARYAAAVPRPDWRGKGPTLLFLGRIDEPRKGLRLLLQALPTIVAQTPGARLLVAGGGDVDAAVRETPPHLLGNVSFLGRVSDDDKRSALATADLFIAPNTGGESFGIILVEAMAAGTTVLASDIPAFRDVIGDGAFGACFRTGDREDLERAVVSMLAEPARRQGLAEAASRQVRRYDWSRLARQVEEIYETVAGPVDRGAMVDTDPTGGPS